MLTLISLVLNIVICYFIFALENPTYLMIGYIVILGIVNFWLYYQIKHKLKFIDDEVFWYAERLVIEKYHLFIRYPLWCKSIANFLWIVGLFGYFIIIPLLIYKQLWLLLIIWFVMLTLSSYITRQLDPFIHLNKNQEAEYDISIILQDIMDKIYSDNKMASKCARDELFR